VSKLIEDIAAVRGFVRASAEATKQSIRAAARVEGQHVREIIDGYALKTEGVFDGVIDEVTSLSAAAQARIKALAESHRESTAGHAKAEREQLATTVAGHQGQAQQLGQAKASSITAAGVDQAQRAADQSAKSGERAQALINAKAEGFSLQNLLASLVNRVRSVASSLAGGMLQAGKDLADAAAQGASTFADGLLKGAETLASKFEGALAQGQSMISDLEDQASSALNQLADNVCAKIADATQAVVAKLLAGRGAAASRIRSIAELVVPLIEATGEAACGLVDEVEQAAVAKLDGLAKDVALSGPADDARARQSDALRASLEKFRAGWLSAMSNLTGETSKGLGDQSQQAAQQAASHHDEVSTSAKQQGATFASQVTKTTDKAGSDIAAASSKVAGHMSEARAHTAGGVSAALSQAQPKFDDVEQRGRAQVSGLIDSGLARNDEVLTQLPAKVNGTGEKTEDSTEDKSSFWEGVWDGIKEWFSDIYHGIGGLLSAYWESLKRGDFWTVLITIIVVVVVVVIVVLSILFPPFGAAVLAILAWIFVVLFWIGIVIGVLALLYDLYMAIFGTGLTRYERGKYVGKAFLELVLLLLSYLKLIKEAQAAAKAATLIARIAQLVEDEQVLARLLALAKGNLPLLLELLELGYDARKILILLEKTKNIVLVAKLLKLGINIDEAIELLSLLGDDVKLLLRLLEEFKPAAIREMLGTLKPADIVALLSEFGTSGLKTLVEELGVKSLKGLLDTFGAKVLKQMVDRLGVKALKDAVDQLGLVALEELVGKLGVAGLKDAIDGLGVATLKSFLADLGVGEAVKLLQELGVKAIKKLLDTAKAQEIKALRDALGGPALKALAEADVAGSDILDLLSVQKVAPAQLRDVALSARGATAIKNGLTLYGSTKAFAVVFNKAESVKIPVAQVVQFLEAAFKHGWNDAARVEKFFDAVNQAPANPTLWADVIEWASSFADLNVGSPALVKGAVVPGGAVLGSKTLSLLPSGNAQTVVLEFLESDLGHAKSGHTFASFAWVSENLNKPLSSFWSVLQDPQQFALKALAHPDVAAMIQSMIASGKDFDRVVITIDGVTHQAGVARTIKGALLTQVINGVVVETPRLTQFFPKGVNEIAGPILKGIKILLGK
jgi:hypothetical protein